MKKFLFVFCMLLAAVSYGQTMPDFDLIKLEKNSDYKAAEPFALQTAVYLLSTPVEKKKDNRLKSLQFLVKWMSGTPDHSFVLDDATAKITRDNTDLFGLYVAGLVKYSVNNKSNTRDPKVVKLNAVISILDYCENPANNVKLTKQLKKLSEARAKGELEKEL